MRTPQGFLFFFFHDYVHLAPGKRFLFIDLAIIIKDTKNHGATCTTSNATRVRAHRGSGSISRGLVFLPIRDTQCLFPFGMTRASKSKLYARRRIATNEERIDRTRRLFIVLEFFVSELGSFYSLTFLCLLLFLIGNQRVWITKSDSHLERTVLLHGNLEDLTSF